MKLPYFLNVGRRGSYLLTMGFLYLVYGYGLVVVVSERPAMPNIIYKVLSSVLPIQYWGWLWFFSGALAIFSAFVPEIKNFHLRSISFAGLMGMATVWALGIVSVEFIVDNVGITPWIAALLFAALMASNAVVSGWPEAKVLK